MEKNREIIKQLETANQLKTQVEEILDRQNKKIEVLQKDKRPKITSWIECRAKERKREELQRKLSDIEQMQKEGKRDENFLRTNYSRHANADGAIDERGNKKHLFIWKNSWEVEVEQLNTEITHLQNEAEVKQMKEYASKREKQKDTDGQSFQEVIPRSYQKM